MINTLIVAALFVLGTLAYDVKISSAEVTFNGSVPLGILEPNKWNQTSITIPSAASGVPLASMWFFFTETATGKPLPTESLQRASLTLTTSNQGLSTYNALTSTINVPRQFGTNPYTIPQGTLTLKATYALGATQKATATSLSWLILEATKESALEHASIFVAGWKTDGDATNEITTTLPYDGIIAWGAGNVLVGGISVTLLNNETSAVICSSTATATGDFTTCTPNTQIAKGTKLTVIVHSNSTGFANNGGIDLYIVKVTPTTSTSTHATSDSTTHATAATTRETTATTHATVATTHATVATATHSVSNGPVATSTHATTASSGPAASGPAASGPASSSGKTTSASAADSGKAATVGYSSGSSGSSGSGTGGFFAQDDSIFSQVKELKDRARKLAPIAISEVQELKPVLSINEVDEVQEGNDHFRVVEEKASLKFL